MNAVQWGEYKLKEIFNHIEQGRRLKKEDQKPGTIPFVMSGTTNQGVVGYISNPVASFPANSITVDIFGNSFYRSYEFGAGDDTGVYWNDQQDYSPGVMLFIAATIGKSLIGKFSYGHKLRSSQSLDFAISLPQTQSGMLDLEFMERFVRELEESRLRELEAYLIATGLNDYHLTKLDLDALSGFNKLTWKKFNVRDLFGKSTRGKRLKSEDRIEGDLPFVTAGEAETGISAFIGNDVDVFSANTTTIDMFGSAKYRNYEFGADDHVAVVHTESLQKNAAIFVASACHKAAHTGEFDYGHNFYAKDADELSIMLPVGPDGKPHWAKMDELVAAIHKLVITDVALFTGRRLEAAREVIKSNSRVEMTKSPRVHKTYRPGFIPLFSLRAACGRFENNEIPEVEGWIDASGLGFSPDKEKHFAIYAKGDSMMPKIHDGDLCVFEWYKGGSREGEIVLTQCSDYDPDYCSKYTIKRYHSEKLISDDNWQHTKIHLLPLNPEYNLIELTSDDEGEYRTIGVFKAVL